MALQSAIPCGMTFRRSVVPVSIESDWVVLNSAPGTLDANPVKNPTTGINSSPAPLTVGGAGTTIQLRLRYPLSGGPSNGATVLIQAFGLDGGSGNLQAGSAVRVPQRLFDGTSSPAHVQTLTVATATDAQDATYGYTEPVELDMQANKQVIVLINTALSGGGTGAAILGRVK